MLDDPSMGIVPIIKIISKINKEGTTILLVEQNARAALKLSQETGRIMFEGPVDKLREDESIINTYLA
jgi:branched-chain amino acid transport system ATP-binding protein